MTERDPAMQEHPLHRELVPAEPLPSLRRRIVTHVLWVLAIAAVVALWVLTPLRQWLDVSKTVTALRALGGHSEMPLLVMLAFVIGGLLVFPVNVLTAASIIIFGNLTGGLYALAGATLSAIVNYELGRIGGRPLLRRFPNSRLHRLSLKLARHGILAVAVLRVVPVAPYSVINLVAGASHINRREFILGTLVGMTPGIALSAVLIDRVLAAIHDPSLGSFAWLALAALLFATASLWLGRRMLKASREQA